MASSNAQRGFTLLEMLVVMVLLGLITSLALPAMQRWHDAVQLRAQAGLVVDVLRAAAFRAASGRMDLVVDASSFSETASPAAVAAQGASPPGEAIDRTRVSDGETAGAAPLAAPSHVAVTLPVGWKVNVVTPARFLSTGLCQAGVFALHPPSGAPVSVKVEGPVCQIALLSDSEAQ